MEDDRQFDLTENSLKVLERRYLKKDKQGNVSETPDELFRRVARAIAEPDKKYGASVDDIKELEDKFYNLIASLEFMPNSPDPDECRATAGTAFGLFCSAHR